MCLLVFGGDALPTAVPPCPAHCLPEWLLCSVLPACCQVLKLAVDAFFLDINCQFSKHVAANCGHLAAGIRFYIGWLHAKAGHNLECQLEFNGLFADGLGRCIGEYIEQLWVRRCSRVGKGWSLQGQACWYAGIFESLTACLHHAYNSPSLPLALSQVHLPSGVAAVPCRQHSSPLPVSNGTRRCHTARSRLSWRSTTLPWASTRVAGSCFCR